MKRVLFWLLLPLFLISIVYFIIKSSHQRADMLLINGNIYTFDSKRSTAEAMAIRENRIAAIGSTDELKKKYSTENIIDLKWKTVIPGLIDGHAHILGEGGRLQILDLTGTNSPERIAEMVSNHAGNIGNDEWIIGRGWDQNDWQINNYPDLEILDKAAPDNPVLLRRVDGHAVWVNSKTLRLASIGSKTVDPAGGKIYRDREGKPTGILVDNAINLVDVIIPRLTDGEIEQRLKLAMNECARLGLTEVHDMGVDLQTIRIYKNIIDNGECPIRIYAAIDGAGETWEYYRNRGIEVGYGNGLLTVRALKLYIDGALGSRGAALMDEYDDDHGNRGLTVTGEDSLTSVCRQAAESGFQVCTHAIGDRGNHIMLNIYENIYKSHLNRLRDARWRIEHVQVVQPGDMPRFKKSGILPSMQPTHATSDMSWAEKRLGPERIRGAYAWRSILETGADIIAGSDFPVESVNPLFGIYAAITRQDKSGDPPGGWFPDQRMSREEAVRSFTAWAAYGSFEEKDKGTIEIGKLADITVLSGDIMKIDPSEIPAVSVEMTIVNGKIVFPFP